MEHHQSDQRAPREAGRAAQRQDDRGGLLRRGDEAAGASRPVLDPAGDLHVCIECASHLAYPIAWEEADDDHWSVTIRCPECETFREGVFSQDAVEAFDEELDAGTDALTADYRRLMRANMAEEVDRFAAALRRRGRRSCLA